MCYLSRDYGPAHLAVTCSSCSPGESDAIMQPCMHIHRNKLYIVDAARIVCGAGSMKRYGVRLSVPAAIVRYSSVQRICCCGPGRQELSIYCCTAGARQQRRRSSTAKASSVAFVAAVQGRRQTCYGLFRTRELHSTELSVPGITCVHNSLSNNRPSFAHHHHHHCRAAGEYYTVAPPCQRPTARLQTEVSSRTGGIVS